MSDQEFQALVAAYDRGRRDALDSLIEVFGETSDAWTRDAIIEVLRHVRQAIDPSRPFDGNGAVRR